LYNIHTFWWLFESVSQEWRFPENIKTKFSWIWFLKMHFPTQKRNKWGHPCRVWLVWDKMGNNFREISITYNPKGLTLTLSPILGKVVNSEKFWNLGKILVRKLHLEKLSSWKTFFLNIYFWNTQKKLLVQIKFKIMIVYIFLKKS